MTNPKSKSKMIKACNTCQHKDSLMDIKPCRYCKRNCAINNDDNYEPKSEITKLFNEVIAKRGK